MPVIPFSDVVGNADNTPPEQIAGTALKVGVVAVPAIVTEMLAVSVQPLASFTIMVYGPLARFRKILLA